MWKKADIMLYVKQLAAFQIAYMSLYEKGVFFIKDNGIHGKFTVSKEIHRLDNLIGRLAAVKSDATESHNITAYNGRIIGYLARSRGRDIFQKDIEKEFCITRSTASRVLSLMEEKGQVVRVRVPGDARLKKLVLTEKSRRFADMLHSVFDEIDDALIEGFTETELESFCGMIERMKANIVAAARQ